jgi:hypothetical protein
MYNIKRSFSKLVGTRRSTVLSLSHQQDFPVWIGAHMFLGLATLTGKPAQLESFLYFWFRCHLAKWHFADWHSNDAVKE